MSWQGATLRLTLRRPDDKTAPHNPFFLFFESSIPSSFAQITNTYNPDHVPLVSLTAHPLRATLPSCVPGSIDKPAERAMQRPKLSPLQSRLLAYLVASSACLALWNLLTPHLLVNAEVLTTPDHDALDSRVVDALVDRELPHIQGAGFDQRGSEGYEPDFGLLDRSLIGRQAAELEKLVNNQKMEKDIGPKQTIHFVLQKDQLRFAPISDDPASAPDLQGTDDGSDEARLSRLEVAGTEGTTSDWVEKRQTSGGNVWLTANTCRQPMPMGNATAASGRNHPQLVMYVSTSPKNQKPGPGATEDTITNITGVLFNGGYANFEFNTSSDVYIGISAPNLNDDWFGSWHFELAASTDGPYHNYNDEDPFLYMVDTDSESALFITYDLSDSNETDVAQKWREQNPFQMYAFTDGDNTPIRGMERSYCAIKDMFNVNTTKNFTIDSSITTKFGVDKKPKTQFHVKGLQAAKTYNGFVVVEGSQEPLYIPNAGMTRGGGRVFQAFNWTTKADDSCQVIFDLNFCDMVAYAVPSNTNFKLNDSSLAEIYDNQARDYYLNFTRSLDQIACDAEPAAQYSLARTCKDCADDYKNWLCMVLIPRCEDWTADDPWLQPRNLNTPFSNSSLPMDGLPPLPDGSMPPALQLNDSIRQDTGFNSSRNPRIDELIKPGPYKEMKPCEDMCFEIVRSCPAKLGFGCPNGKLRDVSYGKRDPDPNKLTCNYPGAVVKLNAPSDAGRLGCYSLDAYSPEMSVAQSSSASSLSQGEDGGGADAGSSHSSGVDNAFDRHLELLQQILETQKALYGVALGYTNRYRSDTQTSSVSVAGEDVPDETSDRWAFSDIDFIRRLYPLRFEQPQASENGSTNLDVLVTLCNKVKTAAYRSQFQSSESMSTFLPLVLERLLACTGDSSLRLGASWDRRPRGTFLDFGWSRKKPDIPDSWSFFEHCRPEHLLACVIGILEVVFQVENALDDNQKHPDHQAWSCVTIGQVLHNLYEKDVLLEINLQDEKTKRSDITTLDIGPKGSRYTALRTKKRLSNIASMTLPANDQPYKTELDLFNLSDLTHSFDSKHLRLDLLTSLGGLNIKWTEYMSEHLTLDTSTLTLRVYWFASHVRKNYMFHLYCGELECGEDHDPGIAMATRYHVYRTHQDQILDSYRWIFDRVGKKMDAYYSLPLPWWLRPLDEPEPSQDDQHSTFSTLLSIILGRNRKTQKTISTLLKDKNGNSCKLPIDCRAQLNPFQYDNPEADSDDEEEDEYRLSSRGVPYAGYPQLSQRIHLLIEHMEKQKPKGFRALWRVNRDSNTWFTFWAAVIFGLTALLLAAASLAVSAAQAWASFHVSS
ncbi:hypothetical protein HRS9122_05310 [Pyrenophora teres f. teres]|nr:hypothetical protein HRS9122_05310 [Pyrenophora teres f. teres]